MKSFIGIILALSLLGVLATQNTQSYNSEVYENEYVYLIAGLDDAASNTDSLMLVSYKSRENTVSIVQIPRDTYCYYGQGLNKINGLFSSKVLAGYSSKASMENTVEFLSEAFGTEINGYLAVTTDAFRTIVDALGGVRVTLSHEFKIYSSGGKLLLSLNEGENLLNGEQSELFVRHRKSFATGDLGRIDNQRIFIDGLIKTVRDNFSVETFLDILKSCNEGVILDFPFFDSAFGILKHKSKFKSTSVVYLTMPGEAISDVNGIWYYILNRMAAEQLVKHCLSPKGRSFDSEHVFTNPEKPQFQRIYYNEDFSFHEKNKRH